MVPERGCVGFFLAMPQVGAGSLKGDLLAKPGKAMVFAYGVCNLMCGTV